MGAVLRAVTSPKDRWHQLADAIGESNLPASDKAVFRFLLDKADYRTAELPAKFTPTQRAIGRKTSHSLRQVRYSLTHLGRHGWVAAGAAEGDGRRHTYTLSCGCACDCPGRRDVAGKGQPEPQIAATPAPYIAATDSGNEAGQMPSRSERQREGGVKRQVSPSTSTRLPPDWPLIRQIVRIVHTDPCGGLHREALAGMLHLPARGRVLGDALGIAYRNKKIDFCGQYVVKPVAGHQHKTSTEEKRA
jgi:hypothetical protein